MRFVITAVLVAVSTLSLMGCGGNSSAVQSGNLTIITQPTSQAVPIGRTATFTVVAEVNPASAAAPTYQWSKNGVEIPDATAASYTIPTVTLADSGAEYQVTVSSGSDSLASSVATLTAGPRAPAIGDVRYLLWEQAGPSNNKDPIGAGIFGAGSGEASITNALGTPLSMWTYPPGCAWNYNYLVLPTSMDGQFTTYYQMDSTSQQSWQSYLGSLGPNNVVISADLEWTLQDCDSIGVAYVWVQAGGFDQKLEEVAPSNVAATIAADATNSRIITAVTYDDSVSPSQVVLISYGWQGDTSTVYESQPMFIPPGSSGVETAAQTATQTLASEGYFISACGGNYTDGWVLVGMRVQGDTVPRPLNFGSGSVTVPPDNAFWTAVAWVDNGGAPIQEQ